MSNLAWQLPLLPNSGFYVQIRPLRLVKFVCLANTNGLTLFFNPPDLLQQQQQHPFLPYHSSFFLTPPANENRKPAERERALGLDPR